MILINCVFPRSRTSLRALERGISSSRNVKEDGDEADCESECLLGIVRVVRHGGYGCGRRAEASARSNLVVIDLISGVRLEQFRSESRG